MRALTKHERYDALVVDACGARWIYPINASLSRKFWWENHHGLKI